MPSAGSSFKPVIKCSRGSSDQRLCAERMRNSQFHMVLMRKIMDETSLFQLGFALSLGFVCFRKEKICETRGHRCNAGSHHGICQEIYAKLFIFIKKCNLWRPQLLVGCSFAQARWFGSCSMPAAAKRHELLADPSQPAPDPRSCPTAAVLQHSPHVSLPRNVLCLIMIIDSSIC